MLNLYSFIDDSFISLDQLRNSSLIKKLVAKDLYHYFYHYLNYEKWDYDRWIPIPIK